MSLNAMPCPDCGVRHQASKAEAEGHALMPVRNCPGMTYRVTGECLCWVGHGDCRGCCDYPGITHEPACGWEQNPDCPEHGFDPTWRVIGERNTVSNNLDRALDDARQVIKAIDDPRNWPDPGLAALKLVVAYVESQQTG